MKLYKLAKSDILENPFKYDSVEALREERAVRIVDQRLFPSHEEFLLLYNEEDVYDAIKKLKVRGAPAIGVCAAYGIWASVANLSSGSGLASMFDRIAGRIASSRPTAVNLGWAVERMNRCFRSALDLYGEDREMVCDALFEEADAIKGEDIAMCEAIGRNGLSLFTRKGMGVLTHCNAGHFAVSRYGTALAPVYMAQSAGLEPRLFSDETRPLHQGSRITMKELMMAGVDATLLCDSMVASLMGNGEVDMVFVGCDRIAANGDTANKIGTCGVALIAHHFGIPVYVLGPSSTIDRCTPTGKDIVIEQRDPSEVTELYFGERMAPLGAKVYNPAFDVTPAEFITGIITEKGIFHYPYNFLEND